MTQKFITTAISLMKYFVFSLFLILGSQIALASHWQIAIYQSPVVYPEESHCETFWSNGVRFRQCYNEEPQSQEVCHQWISRHGYIHQSCYAAAPMQCYQWISHHGYIHQRCY